MLTQEQKAALALIALTLANIGHNLLQVTEQLGEVLKVNEGGICLHAPEVPEIDSGPAGVCIGSTLLGTARVVGYMGVAIAQAAADAPLLPGERVHDDKLEDGATLPVLVVNGDITTALEGGA